MNPTPSPSSTLRPLGLGEILDRAVNLSVKYVTTFALIYAAFAVPMAILQYLGSGDQTRSLTALSELLRAQAAGGKAASPASLSSLLSNYPVLTPALGLLWAAFFFIYPLPKAALIVATSSAYLRGAADFGQAYRTALRRWLPLIALNVLYVLCASVLYVVFVFAGVVIVLALSAVTATMHALGVALSVAVLIALVVFAFLFALVAVLAYEVSTFTCVLEDASFLGAFGRGVERVFRGAGLRRSLVVGLAYIAVVIAITVVAAMGAVVLFSLLHSPVVDAIFSTLLSLATAAFVTAFVGIFYFDLRVRGEGFDLQLAAGTMEPATFTST